MNDQDLVKIDKLLQKRLKNFATKDDLKAALKENAIEITEDISEVVTKLFQQVENTKADKEQTLSHEIRLQKLESKVFPQ